MTALQRSMIRELPDDQSGLRLQLWNFVGNESFSFLINLTDPVASWDKHEGFCDTKKVIDNHLVVNDTAKCGVKLITDLNKNIVKQGPF